MNINLFGLTKKGEYIYKYIWVEKKGEYKYKYIRVDKQGPIRIQIFVTHCTGSLHTLDFLDRVQAASKIKKYRMKRIPRGT